MRPGPWNPDPVYDNKFVKIVKNWYSVYDYQVKFNSFIRHNVWFLDPVHKISSKISEFEALFVSGRSKNHTLKACTSPLPPGRIRSFHTRIESRSKLGCSLRPFQFGRDICFTKTTTTTSSIYLALLVVHLEEKNCQIWINIIDEHQPFRNSKS